MPLITDVRDRKLKQEVDAAKLHQHLIEAVVEYDVVLIVIERVQSSTQMGVASAFTFGRAYGVAGAVADIIHPNVEYVAPQKWKPRMCLPPDKNKVVEMAQKIYGTEFINLKKHDGRAEAAFLARFGAMEFLLQEYDPLA